MSDVDDNMDTEQSDVEDDIVILDVGGTTFKSTSDCLLSHPHTRLTSLVLNALKVKDRGRRLRLFVNRDPVIFHHILNWYRTSELHLPSDLCGNAIRNELEFWKIPETEISPCCWRPMFHSEQDDHINSNLTGNTKESDISLEGLTSFRRFQLRAWLVMTKPNSSKLAKAWNTIQTITIIVSAILIIVESIPSLRVKLPEMTTAYYNKTLERAHASNPRIARIMSTVPHASIYYLDFICLIIFTLEFTLNFITCPRKWRFFKEFINWVDIITIFSGQFVQIVEFLFSKRLLPFSDETFYIYFAFKLIYSIRLLKLFRLAQRFIGLKIMLLSIWHSRKELLLLIFSFLILATIFGNGQYYFEFANDKFGTIPICIWWAVITMTTVGYGDVYPTTFAGYIMGTICSLLGVLIMSMPVAVIAANFNEYYSRSQFRESRKRKEKLSARLIKTNLERTAECSLTHNFAAVVHSDEEQSIGNVSSQMCRTNTVDCSLVLMMSYMQFYKQSEHSGISYADKQTHPDQLFSATSNPIVRFLNLEDRALKRKAAVPLNVQLLFETLRFSSRVINPF